MYIYYLCFAKILNGWLPLNVFVEWLCPTCVTGTWVTSSIDVILIWYHYFLIYTLVTIFKWWLSSKDMNLRVLIKVVLAIFHWLMFRIIYIYIHIYIYKHIYIYIYIYIYGWASLTMALNGKLVYMTYHFILLRLNLFELLVDRERWELEHYVSYLQVCLSAEGSKKFPGPGYLPSKDGVVWLLLLLVTLYIHMNI